MCLRYSALHAILERAVRLRLAPAVLLDRTAGATYSQSDSGVRLQLVDPLTGHSKGVLCSAVLVAADGPGSRVRGRLLPRSDALAPAPAPERLVMVRGTGVFTRFLDSCSMVAAGGGDHRLLCFPVAEHFSAEPHKGPPLQEVQVTVFVPEGPGDRATEACCPLDVAQRLDEGHGGRLELPVLDHRRMLMTAKSLQVWDGRGQFSVHPPMTPGGPWAVVGGSFWCRWECAESNGEPCSTSQALPVVLMGPPESAVLDPSQGRHKGGGGVSVPLNFTRLSSRCLAKGNGIVSHKCAPRCRTQIVGDHLEAYICGVPPPPPPPTSPVGGSPSRNPCRPPRPHKPTLPQPIREPYPRLWGINKGAPPPPTNTHTHTHTVMMTSFWHRPPPLSAHPWTHAGLPL